MAQIRLQLHILTCAFSLHERVLDVSLAQLESILCHLERPVRLSTGASVRLPYLRSGVMVMTTSGALACPLSLKLGIRRIFMTCFAPNCDGKSAAFTAWYLRSHDCISRVISHCITHVLLLVSIKLCHAYFSFLWMTAPIWACCTSEGSSWSKVRQQLTHTHTFQWVICRHDSESEQAWCILHPSKNTRFETD